MSSPAKSAKDEDEPAHTIPSDSLQRPPELAPHGEAPLFHVVTDLFQMIADNSGPGVKRTGRQSAERKRQILASFFESWRLRVGKDLFPLIRMLIPERDRQRPNYGLKEQALAKGYIAALGLAPSTSAAKKLLSWKAPESNEKGAGDFAQIAYDVISERTVRTRGKLTVDEVNAKLDELARASGDGKNKVLASFANGLSAQEQKWLIRIILKDLKISIRERTVLSVLHPDATDLFNVCSDLQRVCYTLYSREIRLPREDSVVGLFKAFRPMLCKRNERDLQHIVRLMTEPGGPEGKTHQDFVIEEKLDGERMQLHKRGSEYRYWSRKDKDYTYLYGKTPDEGSLTPWIHSAFHQNVEEIILDGEMLVWDPDLQKTQPFGNLKTAALNPTSDPRKCRPLFRVFDVLYVKGRTGTSQSLVHKPLSARKAAMRQFFGEVKTRLEYAYETKGKTAEDIRTTLQRIVEERGEGLVIKRNDAHYVLNGREDSWIKVKPDYMDELGETFDLIVVGAYWGQGRRGGRFGSFMCALREDPNQAEDPEARYLTFCKVGSGFSWSVLNGIMTKYGPSFTPWDRKNSRKNPDWLVVGKIAPELPDCWIHPHDSFMVKVKAAEIAGGEGYGVGKCLRFPRCIETLPERTYADAFTMEDLWAVMAGNGREAKKVGEKLSGHKDKRRKVNPRKKAEILASHKGADVTGMAVTGDIFKGFTFYIMEGPAGADEAESKQSLEKLVFQHGGEYVQTFPKKEPSRIVAQTGDYYSAKKAVKKGLDIVHPSWVVDSVARGRLLPLTRRYLVHASEDTKASSDYEVSDDEDGDVKMESSPTPGVGPDGEASATEDDEEDLEREKRRKSPTKKRGTSPGEGQAEALLQEGWISAAAFREAEGGSPQSKGQNLDYDSDAASETEIEDDELDPQVIEGSSGPERFESLDIGEKLESRDHDAGPGMGADKDVMHYDAVQIFKSLVFYIDSVANAERNGMPVANVEAEQRKRADQLYDQARDLLTANGGEIVDETTDNNLTHIIVADEDTSRVPNLMKRTKRERLRRLVKPSWVIDSLAEGTLLDERSYVPNY